MRNRRSKLDALITEFGDLQLDGQYVLKSCRRSVLALYSHSGPAHRRLKFIMHHYRSAQASEECMLCLFHVQKECREMDDTCRICFAEFDAALVEKRFGHDAHSKKEAVGFPTASRSESLGCFRTDLYGNGRVIRQRKAEEP